MVSEVLDKMECLGYGIVFKIDFEKTCDCVDWEFLWFVFAKIGVDKVD